MSTKIGAYSEITAFKNVEDDGWRIFYEWYTKGCRVMERPVPGEKDKAHTLEPDEIKIIEAHASREEPKVIRKGEKHVRKFLYDSFGSIIWRCNLEIYNIAMKYKVFPPDQWDFSQNTNTPTHVYNQTAM